MDRRTLKNPDEIGSPSNDGAATIAGGVPYRASIRITGSAEMLHWRTRDDLEFAVVIWKRHGDGKATTYVSSNDTALAVKLSGLIGDHKSG